MSAFKELRSTLIAIASHGNDEKLIRAIHDVIAPFWEELKNRQEKSVLPMVGGRGEFVLPRAPNESDRARIQRLRFSLAERNDSEAAASKILGF